MRLRLRLLCLAPLAFVLAACQSSGGLGSGGSSASSGSGASASASATASASSTTRGASSASISGECAAASFQNLVGTSGDAVNRSSLPPGTRVLRPTTPMSTDYRTERMNVYIDASGQVEKVVCG